jgi:hypothetical protein
MASVSPGYTFTGPTDPITSTKLNLLGQPTVTIGNNEIVSDNLASDLVISGLTIAPNTALEGSASTEVFSGTITITCDNLHGNTRIVNCTSSTSATLNASAVLPAGTHLNIIFTTDGTASNTITFGTNFKKTGTYALNSANKHYVAMFISDGTYWVEASRAGPSS